MLALDTNVLLRLLVRDDASQAALADEGLPRVAGFLSWCWPRRFGCSTPYTPAHRNNWQLHLDLLLVHDSLVLQDADVVTAAVQQFRARPALGFSDCLVLEIARKAGHLPLATFDKALAKLPGAQKI